MSMDPFSKFNEETTRFINDMIILFPNEPKLKSYQFLYNQIRTSNYRKPVEIFMESLEPFGLLIMTKDELFFKLDSYVNNVESLTGKLGLIEMWTFLSDDIKNKIWSYFLVLYVLGMKALNKTTELKIVLDAVKKIKV